MFASFSGEAGVYALLMNLFVLRLGFGPVFIGQMAALVSITYGTCAIPASALGRKFGTTRVMLIALCVVAVSYASMPAAGLLPQQMQKVWLASTRLLVGVGWTLWDVNSRTYLMSVTANDDRPHAFAIMGAIGPLIGLLGMLAGGVLPSSIGTWRGVSLTEALPYQYSLWVGALLFLPAPFVMLSVPKVRAPTRGAVVRATQAAPIAVILWIVLVIMLQLVVNNAIAVFANVYMDSELGVPTATVGIIRALGQLISVPAVLLTPLLLRRWSRQRVFTLTAFGVAVSMLPAIVFPSLWAMTLSLFGVVALNIIAFATICLFQMEVVTAEWRPAMSGAMSLASALSSGITSYAGGLIITAHGYRTLFGLSAVLTALGAAVFLVVFGRKSSTFPGGAKS